MVINTNLQAQINADNLQATQARLSKSLARLSSGSKIVSAADDAAGLAVASRLDAQVNRTAAANNNVSNAISFTQTQDGYLQKIAVALNRMSELSILAQDGTKTDADRALYNKEFTELSSYIGTAASKDFNGVSLFSTNAISVTIDSEGGQLNMAGVNLGAATYTSALGANVGTTTAVITHNAAIAAMAGTTDRQQGKPERGQLAHRGRGRRRRIHRIRQAEHPASIRHRHARAGKPVAAKRAPAVAISGVGPGLLTP